MNDNGIDNYISAKLIVTELQYIQHPTLFASTHDEVNNLRIRDVTWRGVA